MTTYSSASAQLLSQGLAGHRVGEPITEVRPATYARIQYHIDPTLPPGQRSVPGAPDPRTATCEQHKVASPYSDTAQGNGTAVPASNGWPCVVCPLPYADLIGAEVILAGHEGSTYVYAGEPRHAGSISIGILIGGGGLSTVNCDPTLIAPAGTPVNDKDARFTVEKLAKKRNSWDAGPWLTHIDGVEGARAHKTKRDAVAYAASRLAIADYHAQRAAASAS